MLGSIHHLGLTVRDAERSATWYHEVLGFECTGDYRAPDGSRQKVFMRHEGLSVRLGLTEHRDGRGGLRRSGPGYRRRGLRGDCRSRGGGISRR